MKDLTLLLLAIQTHGWQAILLRPRSKRPLATAHWQVTAETRVIEDHLRAGGNVGLIGHQLTIIDFDVSKAMTEMFETLGPLPLTVRTGSGKHHSYLAGDGSLPAKIRWHGVIVGEIQRHVGQYVVCPPSVHPDTGERYIWLSDPTEELPSLPPAWRNHLDVHESTSTRGQRPDHVKEGDTRGQASLDEWYGPTPKELIRRALRQPGARRRAAGVKFQCPKCRQDGHDKHKDNAQVRNDGRWGCAFAPNDLEHRRAIGEAIGTIPEEEIHTLDSEIQRGIDLNKTEKLDTDEDEELRSLDLNDTGRIDDFSEDELPLPPKD